MVTVIMQIAKRGQNFNAKHFLNPESEAIK